MRGFKVVCCKLTVFLMVLFVFYKLLHLEKCSRVLTGEIEHPCNEKHQCYNRNEGEISLVRDRSAMSTVITVWPRDKVFTFKEALPLLSITKVLKADLIWILYCTYPVQDDYNQWLGHIARDFPFLRFEKCRDCCFMKKLRDDWLIAALTRKGGGMYVSYDVILMRLADDFYTRNGLTVRNSQGDIEILVMKPHMTSFMYQKVNSGVSYFLNNSVRQEVTFNPNITCDSVTQLTEEISKKPVQCYNLRKIESAGLHPSDIWSCHTAVCAELRNLMYSSHDVIKPIKSYNLTPKILHYIWFGRNTDISYTFYLSVLSFVYVGGFKEIYLHCDNVPAGRRWKDLTQNLKTQNIKIKTVYRVNPKTVFNQSVFTVQHMADVMKADIAYRYGGVISDIDVLLVRPLAKHFFTYDFVLGKDVGKHGNFPDIVNMGIVMSKPGSRFSRVWMKSMETFRDADWLWNAGMVTYKLIEHDPRLVHLETHLQVICYNYKFHPTWIDKQFYQDLNHTFKGFEKVEKWIDHTYSFHFTEPVYFHSEDYLKQQKNLVDKIGWYIVSKSRQTMKLDNENH